SRTPAVTPSTAVGHDSGLPAGNETKPLSQPLPAQPDVPEKTPPAAVPAGPAASQTTDGNDPSLPARGSEDQAGDSALEESGSDSQEPKKHGAYTQPSLIGTEDTLWVVVYHDRDMPNNSRSDALVSNESSFHPPKELKIVEYALTYHENSDGNSRLSFPEMSSSPEDSVPSRDVRRNSMKPSGRDDSNQSQDTGEPPTAGGLEEWKTIAEPEMATAAAQLGVIDREVIESTRGVERRESAWPVSRTARTKRSETFDLESGEIEREFQPPSSVIDLNERGANARPGGAPRPSGEPTGLLDDGFQTKAIEYRSLLIPEAVRLRFRYHDGSRWHSQWDSRARNGFPRAVEILAAILPTDKAAVERELNRFEDSESSQFGPWLVVRHVVALPVAQGCGSCRDGLFESGATTTEKSSSEGGTGEGDE
ncbi:MAG: type II secretion system protein GspJ, partial [Planctomycetes bacterium]|nr:type II secretion system protein GspJ [Planctomycetota bacterium]